MLFSCIFPAVARPVEQDDDRARTQALNNEDWGHFPIIALEVEHQDIVYRQMGVELLHHVFGEF